MQQLRTARALIGIIASAIIASVIGCSPTTVEKTWTAPPAMRASPLQNVVTVFVSTTDNGNITMRRASEDRLARDLAKRGVRATPGYAVLTDEERADTASVKSRLLAMGYDGVVTMRIVERYQELEYMPPTFDGYWGGHVHPYYSGGFYSPGYAYTESIVRVETSAYSLKNNQLVWSALTRIETEDAGEVVNESSKVVAQQLTKRGLAT
jgi:hypothetical protein